MRGAQVGRNAPRCHGHVTEARYITPDFTQNITLTVRRGRCGQVPSPAIVPAYQEVPRADQWQWPFARVIIATMTCVWPGCPRGDPNGGLFASVGETKLGFCPILCPRLFACIECGNSTYTGWDSIWGSLWRSSTAARMSVAATRTSNSVSIAPLSAPERRKLSVWGESTFASCVLPVHAQVPVHIPKTVEEQQEMRMLGLPPGLRIATAAPR